MLKLHEGFPAQCSCFSAKLRKKILVPDAAEDNNACRNVFLKSIQIRKTVLILNLIMLFFTMGAGSY